VVGSVEKHISQSADLTVAAPLLLVLRVVEETDTWLEEPGSTHRYSSQYWNENKNNRYTFISYGQH